MKGIIYKISQPEKCYYGCTVRNGYTRFQEHKRHAKYNLHNLTNSHTLFIDYTIEPQFQVLEEIEFNDIQELKNLENKYINNDLTCLNRRINLNYDTYWHKNKTNIQIKRRNKIFNCECGCDVQYYTRLRHMRSKKHFKLLCDK